MRVSKRGEYALRALINSRIAQEMGRPILQIKELAERENIPVKFLDRILLDLKQTTWLESKRDPRGGYFFAQQLSQIKIGQVVRLMDGPLAMISCTSVRAYHPYSCPDETHCGLHMLMLDVRNAISEILDNHTLADMVEITLRKMKHDKSPLPFQDLSKK